MKNQFSTISFTKMQGAGNDFIVINNLQKQFSKEDLIRLTPVLCDRKFGIGSDGLLALLPSQQEEADYTMFYRNPDGSDAGMCGNGARCLAFYACQLGFGRQHTFRVHGQQYRADIVDVNRVRIFFPDKAAVNAVQIENQQLWQTHPGTEHVVLPVDTELLNQEDELIQRGRMLRYHSAFQPKGTNVNFISGLGTSSLKLQTYERGVENLTLACGTGAIASALVWHHLGKKDEAHIPYEVITEGGPLQIYFSFDEQANAYTDLRLEGPAHIVFEGRYPLSA